MRDVFICDAIRTPIGRFGGGLSTVRADDLAALPIKALMERKKDLAGQVKNFLLTLDDQKYTMKDGSYCVSLKVRPTWTYSDELTALINRLAADKKTEQQTGKATAVENVYVDGRVKA